MRHSKGMQLTFVVIAIASSLFVGNRIVDSQLSKQARQTQLLSEVTPTPIPSGCTRELPYNKPPEFSRALSIIKQRIEERYPKYFFNEYENCLNMQYKNLKNFGSGPEGIFLFDTPNSSTNNLLIYVDTSYKGYDDLLTVLLLAHEIAHADQYYSEISHGNKLTCIEKEVQAFLFQAQLFSILKPEELS